MGELNVATLVLTLNDLCEAYIKNISSTICRFLIIQVPLSCGGLLDVKHLISSNILVICSNRLFRIG